MAKLIKNRRIVEDSWQLLPTDAAAVPEEYNRGDVIVPLSLWKSGREALLARAAAGKGRLGVWIEGHDEPAAIAADLGHFAIVAVHTDKFVDGRLYSTGRLLRERHGFKAELRAFGDLLRDHLLMLERCGYDSFVLRASEDLQESLAAFGEFSDQYQASAAEPAPLFKRRLAANS